MDPADTMDAPSDLDKLRFYRDEVKHEFNLLAMRSTMLITCQSFLIVPFAILHTADPYRSIVVPLLMVASMGLFVAIMLRAPMAAAERTIDKWLQKQRALLQASPSLHDLALDRDRITGANEDSSRDADHRRSLAFSRRAPVAFVVFWTVAIVWILTRASLAP
jgi:hypothetical protein